MACRACRSRAHYPSAAGEVCNGDEVNHYKRIDTVKVFKAGRTIQSLAQCFVLRCFRCGRSMCGKKWVALFQLDTNIQSLLVRVGNSPQNSKCVHGTTLPEDHELFIFNPLCLLSCLRLHECCRRKSLPESSSNGSYRCENRFKTQ